ncbi:MAG: hypothetical protein HC771_21670, partial [Synechococcales cyanobacterium CRU_2_2]|nr:hypothetical protein [Synechococcales cyanobacterium CRU_2_2]
DDCYRSCLHCGVLDKHEHVEPIAEFLKSIKPMPAAFDQHYVKRLQGTNVKKGTKREQAEALFQNADAALYRAKQAGRDAILRASFEHPLRRILTLGRRIDRASRDRPSHLARPRIRQSANRP